MRYRASSVSIEEGRRWSSEDDETEGRPRAAGGRSGKEEGEKRSRGNEEAPRKKNLKSKKNMPRQDDKSKSLKDLKEQSGTFQANTLDTGKHASQKAAKGKKQGCGSLSPSTKEKKYDGVGKEKKGAVAKSEQKKSVTENQEHKKAESLEEEKVEDGDVKPDVEASEEKKTTTTKSSDKKESLEESEIKGEASDGKIPDKDGTRAEGKVQKEEEKKVATRSQEDKKEGEIESRAPERGPGQEEGVKTKGERSSSKGARKDKKGEKLISSADELLNRSGESKVEEGAKTELGTKDQPKEKGDRKLVEGKKPDVESQPKEKSEGGASQDTHSHTKESVTASEETKDKAEDVKGSKDEGGEEERDDKKAASATDKAKISKKAKQAPKSSRSDSKVKPKKESLSVASVKDDKKVAKSVESDKEKELTDVQSATPAGSVPKKESTASTKKGTPVDVQEVRATTPVSPGSGSLWTLYGEKVFMTLLKQLYTVISTFQTLTSSLLYAAICCSLSSFQMGYSIGCMSAPSEEIKKWITISHTTIFKEEVQELDVDMIWKTMVAAFPLGGVIGALSAGLLANLAGRRGSILYTNIITFLAAGLMASAKHAGVYEMIYLGRFCIGVYVGTTVIVPMYLMEIAPTDVRGFIGSFHQLLITFSILFSQILGHPLLLGTEERWPYIFAFVAVPAVVQVYTLPNIPESPRFTLCLRGEVEQARNDLEILRGTRQVDAEMNALRAEAEMAAESDPERPSMFEMLGEKYRWPLTIVVVMMVAQQLTGINAVLFYSTTIFKQVGLGGDHAIYATIGVGVVNLLWTFVQMYLIDHPYSGRRQLMLAGVGGMIVSSGLLPVFYTLMLATRSVLTTYGAVTMVMLFMISFATGPAAIPWILPSELFLSNARANGNAYMAAAHWLSTSFVGYTFLSMDRAIGQFSFLFFTLCLLAYFWFIWRYLPETKCRSIEEIVAEFEK